MSGKDIVADDREDIGLNLEVYQCYLENCFTADTIEDVVNERPGNFTKWSEPESWGFAEEGWGGYNQTLPMENEDVTIKSGKYTYQPALVPKYDQSI